MFRSALVKLTVLYILILITISLFFSINLYRISSLEVNARLQRQVDFFSQNQFGLPRSGFDALTYENERVRELSESKRHVFDQLLYANIAIAILGGLGSYLLAKRTLQPIEEAHEAQMRFTADASHELRTPLAAMRAETEVTLRNPKLTSKEARTQLESNMEELVKLTALSEGLLQLARGFDGTGLDEVITVKQIVDAAVKQVDHQAKTLGIKLNVESVVATDVKGSKAQLTQLFVILLDNAIKYSSKGDTVTLSTKLDKELHISVSDQGLGIKADELVRVFDRFYRSDNARNKTTVGGYGLGLSIAKQIVENHQGGLSVSSQPGKGSVFTVTLPTHKT